MSTARKIGYNFLIRLMSGAIGLALALFSLGFITRAIGSQGYGQYSLALAFLAFFQISADFGLQNLLTREISKNDAAEKDIVSNFFTLRLVLSILLILPAPLLVMFFPYSVAVKIGVAVAVLGSLFSSLSQIFLAVFQKYLQTYFWALAETSARTIQFILFFAGLQLGFGLFWFLAVYIVTSLTVFLLNLFFVLRRVKFSIKIDFGYWKQILRWALPIAISLLFTMLYFKIDTLMLGFFKTEKEVGLYGFAYKILEIAISFAAMFIGLIMPFLSRYAAESLDNFKKIFQKAFDILALAAMPLVFGGVILANPLVEILAGRDFSGSASALQILLGATAVIFFGTLAANAAVALNQQKKAALAYGAGAVFNIITNLIFIPKYSYLGAAATTVATEILVAGILLWIIFNKIKYFPAFKNFLKSVCAALLMSGGLILAKIFFGSAAPLPYFALSIIFGALIYGGVIYFIGGVTKNDLAALKGH